MIFTLNRRNTHIETMGCTLSSMEKLLVDPKSKQVGIFSSDAFSTNGEAQTTKNEYHQ